MPTMPIEAEKTCFHFNQIPLERLRTYLVKRGYQHKTAAQIYRTFAQIDFSGLEGYSIREHLTNLFFRRISEEFSEEESSGFLIGPIESEEEYRDGRMIGYWTIHTITPIERVFPFKELGLIKKILTRSWAKEKVAEEDTKMDNALNILTFLDENPDIDVIGEKAA